MRDACSAREKRDLRIIDSQPSTSSDKERKEQVMRCGLARMVIKTGLQKLKKGIDLRRGTSASGRRSEGLTTDYYQMTIPDDYAVPL